MLTVCLSTYTCSCQYIAPTVHTFKVGSNAIDRCPPLGRNNNTSSLTLIIFFHIPHRHHLCKTCEPSKWLRRWWRPLRARLLLFRIWASWFDWYITGRAGEWNWSNEETHICRWFSEAWTFVAIHFLPLAVCLFLNDPWWPQCARWQQYIFTPCIALLPAVGSHLYNSIAPVPYKKVRRSQIRVPQFYCWKMVKKVNVPQILLFSSS